MGGAPHRVMVRLSVVCGRYALRRRGVARVAAIIEALVRPALKHVGAEDGETFIRLRAVLSGEDSELLEKLVAENFDRSSGPATV